MARGFSPTGCDFPPSLVSRAGRDGDPAVGIAALRHVLPAGSLALAVSPLGDLGATEFATGRWSSGDSGGRIGVRVEGPSARAGRSATHHGARPAAGLAEQPVDADHAVGPRGGADVDHGVSGGHRVEPGGPEPFGRGGARPAPAPATRGFAR